MFTVSQDNPPSVLSGVQRTKYCSMSANEKADY